MANTSLHLAKHGTRCGSEFLSLRSEALSQKGDALLRCSESFYLPQVRMLPRGRRVLGSSAVLSRLFHVPERDHDLFRLWVATGKIIRQIGRKELS